MKLHDFRNVIGSLLKKGADLREPGLMAEMKAAFRNKIRTTVKDDLSIEFGEVMTMKTPKSGLVVRTGMVRKFGQISKLFRAKFQTIRNERREAAKKKPTVHLRPPADLLGLQPAAATA